MAGVIGVDFGTTNSVVSVLRPDGSVETARHAGLDVFRTVLCFWMEEGRGRTALRHAAGPAAVDAYLEEPLDSRLIMSMKTYLAQHSFTQTQIFGRPFTLEHLIACFLRSLLGEAHAGSRIVVGRPVRFAGDRADDAFGEVRLRAAFAEAGFPDVTVALEPEAAGYRMARSLDSAATVLVGDFGGGTSDFSVMRFEPGAERRVQALGYAGIGIAGDTFDFRIIDRVVSPLLGKGDSYTVMGSVMPVPVAYFSAFARWHLLSMMRAPRTLRDIATVASTSAHPERLRALIRLIENEMGFPLYQAVSGVKAALSGAEEAVLRFSHRGLEIEETIQRAAFDEWIAEDLERIGGTIDRALENAGVDAAEVDRVFLTGGTSFVPAVRGLFERRFGGGKISGGGEFVSVAEGLALMGKG